MDVAEHTACSIGVYPQCSTVTDDTRIVITHGRDLQVSNIVSFTVAIGLAVDDTIHFVARYREERLLGHAHPLAMHRTMLGAGHAIVLTSIL